MHSMETEEWRPVAGFEGLYEISNTGRVKRLERVSAYTQGGRERSRTLPELVMRPVDRCGYNFVLLRKQGETYAKQVHRLVAEAFIPNPDNLPFVLHWDDVRKNNWVSNLRWGSPSENLHDTVRNGNHPGKNKTRCPHGHLLKEPNLVPSSLLNGARRCLSCKRARSNAARDNRPFTKERADSSYRRIMEEIE